MDQNHPPNKMGANRHFQATCSLTVRAHVMLVLIRSHVFMRWCTKRHKCYIFIFGGFLTGKHCLWHEHLRFSCDCWHPAPDNKKNPMGWRSAGLKMPIHAHFFWWAILTVKRPAETWCGLELLLFKFEYYCLKRLKLNWTSNSSGDEIPECDIVLFCYPISVTFCTEVKGCLRYKMAKKYRRKFQPPE